MRLTAEADELLTWNLTRPTTPSIPAGYGKVLHRELSNDVGYIGLANEEIEMGIVEPFREALNALSHSRGIVIDLRGNTGGSDEQGTHYQEV